MGIHYYLCVTISLAILLLISCDEPSEAPSSMQSESHSRIVQPPQPQLTVRPNPPEYDRICSEFFREFSKLDPGMPLSSLGSAFSSKGWVVDSLINRITFQTGKHGIRLERGTSVFTLWPFIDEYDQSQIGYFWCINIKT